MRPIALPRRLRPSRRTAAAALLAVVLLVMLWLWLRDSSLVAVRNVEVSGVSGPDAPRVRGALDAAAREMTTLHVDRGRLREAVQAYPSVAGLEVDRDLPHGLRIRVRQHVAVGALALGPRRIAVAADGTILPTSSPVGLPLVPISTPPGGRRLVERTQLRLVALLGAAPAALRAHVERVTLGEQGLTAQIVRGPALYFGSDVRLVAKWRAAARVLADPSSKGARYIDLHVPERPAAGGLEPAQPQSEVEGSGEAMARPEVEGSGAATDLAL